MDDIGVGQIFLVEKITKSKTFKQSPTVWLLQINLGSLENMKNIKVSLK